MSYSAEILESEQAQSVPITTASAEGVDLPPPSRAATILRKTLILAMVLGVIGFAVWKIHNSISDPQPTEKKGSGGERAIPVVTALVQQKEMPIYLTALGTVTAYYSVTIKSRVDGELMAVAAQEGQSVKKGQLIAQIDPEPYKAVLAQAEGQLAKDQATAVYANAAADRYSSLFKAGVVSQDLQQTQVSLAGQSAGVILADKAAVQAAKVNLAYTRITSPIDGVVGLRQVDPGNIVHAADATGLVLVTQLQPITVIFTLPEDQLPQVQQMMLKGTKLVAEAYDHAETTRLATGKLLTLDNQINTMTGTDKAKAVFDNKDHVLFPNQFVNVRLILQKKPDALVIPAAAVQSGPQGNFVYVVKQGEPPNRDEGGSKPGSGKSRSEHGNNSAPAPSKDSGVQEKAQKYYVAMSPIVIDATEGTQVIVSSGVAPGEQVVVDGLEKLKNGSRVSPKDDAPKSGHKSFREGNSQSNTPDTSQPTPGSKDETASPKTHEHGHPQ